MKVFSFKKLIVWQKSRELSKPMHNITKQSPEEERFRLVSQMRRCSISYNIAEATGRHTHKDKARFTEIAYGSAPDLINQEIYQMTWGFSLIKIIKVFEPISDRSQQFWIPYTNYK